MGLHGVIGGYKGFRLVTRVYGDYKRIQRITLS